PREPERPSKERACGPSPRQRLAVQRERRAGPSAGARQRAARRRLRLAAAARLVDRARIPQPTRSGPPAARRRTHADVPAARERAHAVRAARRLRELGVAGILLAESRLQGL